MEQIVLVAETRTKKGSAEARRLRRSNFIPAILYGAGEENLKIKISYGEFDKLRKAHRGEHGVIDLNLKEQKKTVHVIMKRVDHDALRGDPVHIDFMAIAMNKAIDTKVAIEHTGESNGVKEGGILDQPLWEIDVRCLPGDMPEKIEVDVSALNIGDALHVKELTISDKIEVITDPELVVFSVVAPKVEEEKPAEEGEEEAVEPEVITAKKDKEAPEEEKEEKKEEKK